MGQREIQEYLNQEALRGYRGFYTLTEISKAIHGNISNTSRQIKQLLKAEVLERNLKGGWKLAVRLNSKYIIAPHTTNIEKCETKEEKLSVIHVKPCRYTNNAKVEVNQ